MRDPDLVERAQRAAMALERAWDRFRTVHGLGAEPLAPVSSYVGYSLEEPWGEPRVVFGVAAEEAEKLAALLNGHDCGGRPAPGKPAVANGRLAGLTAAAEIARAVAGARLQVPTQPPAAARERLGTEGQPAAPGGPERSRPADGPPRSDAPPQPDRPSQPDRRSAADGVLPSNGIADSDPGMRTGDGTDALEPPPSAPRKVSKSPQPDRSATSVPAAATIPPAPVGPAELLVPPVSTAPAVPTADPLDPLTTLSPPAAVPSPTEATPSVPPAVPPAAAISPAGESSPSGMSSPPAGMISPAGMTSPAGESLAAGKSPAASSAMAISPERQPEQMAGPADGDGLTAFRPGSASLPADAAGPDPFTAEHRAAAGQQAQRPRSHRHAMQRPARQRRGSVDAEADQQLSATQAPARRAGGQRQAGHAAGDGHGLAAMAGDLAGWASGELPGQAAHQAAPWTPTYRDPDDADPADGNSRRDKVI